MPPRRGQGRGRGQPPRDSPSVSTPAGSATPATSTRTPAGATPAFGTSLPTSPAENPPPSPYSAVPRSQPPSPVVSTRLPSHGPQRGGAAGQPGRPPAITPSSPTTVRTRRPAEMITAGLPRVPQGKVGRPIALQTNHFKIKIGSRIVHHYDVVIKPEEKPLPSRAKFEIIASLQASRRDVFTPRCVYDGQANIYSTRIIPDGQYEVARDIVSAEPNARPSRMFTVTLTKVAEVNLESLLRVTQGQQAVDPSSLTALNALNVVIRMQPQQTNPSNSRSFFTPDGARDIGSGISLWRGYFQSVRLSIGTLLANVDISTATMYKPGPLIGLCIDILGRGATVNTLTASNIQMPAFNKLNKLLSNVRIEVIAKDKTHPKSIKRLFKSGAKDYSFETRDGKKVTVANYFKQVYNKTLQYPGIVMAEVGAKAYIPLELCTVPPGQFLKKEIPSDMRKEVLDFATKKPLDRLKSIQDGWNALQYGQSEYIRDFGMEIDNRPVDVHGRVINAPNLIYAKSQRVPPRNGAWNSGQFYQPATVSLYGIIVFDSRFRREAVPDLIRNLAESARASGMNWEDNQPVCHFGSPQGDIMGQLRSLGQEVKEKRKKLPDLVIVVLPEGGSDIRDIVKHFGDVLIGVATQCLLGSKCGRPKPGYFANVMLKINVKKGGCNVRIDPQSSEFFKEPIIVMGADVIHPPPGAQGRPSFASLVSSVDSFCIKYIAGLSVQKARQEHIDGLGEMALAHFRMHMQYKTSVEKLNEALLKPRRILYYRDGVSEGQFAHVKMEVNAIKTAAEKLGISAKVTAIVVGKRHHARFFPSPRDADKSGNCPAGTVIDNGLPLHPVDWDFYLYSHSGLLGTSRPAHYNPIVDENGYSNDTLQAMSFALCHVYARSTRSVSIPAPTYYADQVCSRWKHHFSPEFNAQDPAIGSDDEEQVLRLHKQGFRPIHKDTLKTMYFM